ncbi:hypothetical protein HZA44_04285 [Candidatus Peregrinibacteria bacterium]|nr:hypothetical protein [Candidatus Peregrinibacteria bacterium]
MKEHFLKFSTLNGSLNGNRYIFAGGEAPKGPEQQAEKPVDEGKKAPENAESAVRETKVEGAKTVKNAKREVMRMEPINIEGRVQKPKQVMRMDEIRIEGKVQKPKPLIRFTEAEAGVIQGKAPKQPMRMEPLYVEGKIQKPKPVMRMDEIAITGRVEKTSANQEKIAELSKQIKEEFSKNPDLAKQLIAQVKAVDAVHPNPEDIKIIADKVDDILVNFSTDKDPRKTRNEISRLGIDVGYAIAQRNRKIGDTGIAKK